MISGLLFKRRGSSANTTLLDLIFSAYTPGVSSAAAWGTLTGGDIVRSVDNATVRTSATTVANADADEARIYYDGTSTGLLIEPEAENIVPDAIELRAAGGWQVGSATNEVADGGGGRPNVLSPNGVDAARRFYGFAASGYTSYINGVNLTTPSCYQFWYRATSGSPAVTAHTLCGPHYPDPSAYVDLVPDATWRLFGLEQSSSNGIHNWELFTYASGARAGTGVSGGALDVCLTLAQLEYTKYATSLIRKQTGVGGSDTRSGDSYSWPAADVVSDGRLSFYWSTIMKADLADMTGDIAIQHGTNSDVYIDSSDGILHVVVDAYDLPCTLPLDWVKNDTLELIIEFGGTSLPAVVYGSVNGEPMQELTTGGGTTMADIDNTGDVEFGSNAGAGQVPQLAQRLTVWSE